MVQVVQRAYLKPQAAGAKVTVACKLPHGLRLRIFEMIDDAESTPTGPRAIKRAQQMGEEVLIHGAGRSDGLLDTRLGTAQAPKARVVFGYALTEGIDKDFFDRWLEQNKDAPYVVNKLVFAMPNSTDADACARENEKRRTGIEMVDPSGDVRARYTRRDITGPVKSDVTQG